MRWFILLLLLSACATAAPPTVAVQVTCLPMATYAPAQEKAVAAEVAALAPYDPLLGFIVDYGAMRSADRACKNSSAP